MQSSQLAWVNECETDAKAIVLCLNVAYNAKDSNFISRVTGNHLRSRKSGSGRAVARTPLTALGTSLNTRHNSSDRLVALAQHCAAIGDFIREASKDAPRKRLARQPHAARVCPDTVPQRARRDGGAVGANAGSSVGSRKLLISLTIRAARRSRLCSRATILRNCVRNTSFSV
jgi:hypothetical protein